MFSRSQRIKSLTVLVVRDDGRGSWSIRLPRFMPAGLRSFAVLMLYLSALLGFQLQALHGLYGAHVDLAMFDSNSERWADFTRLAPTVEGPTRAQLQLRIARERALRLGLGTRHAASELWAGNVAPEWLADMRHFGNRDGTLLWPVPKGMYGRGFGSGAAGYHLAVDIDGPMGSPVVASASGTVGYAGSELSGYGNLVMLIHPGGWVTLYGHNKKILVTPGERVHAGQPIAELGSTGRSMGPHVHFELVHNGRNCDPLPLFRFQTPERPGRLPFVELAQWIPSNDRPSAVRCARRKDHPHPSHDIADPEASPDEASDDADNRADATDESDLPADVEAAAPTPSKASGPG